MADMRSLRDKAQATPSLRFCDLRKAWALRVLKAAAIPIVLMGAKIHFPETTLGTLEFFAG